MKNELLRKARENHGWTQQHLAEIVGVEKQTVKSWESGRRHPLLETRVHLCQIFGMTAKELGLETEAETDNPLQPAQTLTHLQPSPDLQRRKGDENRRRMLKRVRNRWITVLSRSLYQNVFIDLTFSYQPEAVINPWETIVHESMFSRQPLPPYAHIIDIYDESDGALLILGAPGAGKSTILLELTRQLIERATIEETHPIPVVFNLSSWSEKQLALPEWLVEELNTKYQVPHKMGRAWIAANKVLPLLDGLDEIVETQRVACVQAINDYRKDHGFVPMAVCCRSDDFFALDTRIALHSAITIEPLSLQQIENYVSKVEKVSGVRNSLRALLRDAGLQEISSTPLMLNIITMTAFHDASFHAILSTKDPIQQRRMIFEQYVEYVLKRRSPNKQYPPGQTIHWLSWLARQMQKHNQAEFYIERMQPDWLSNKSFYQRYYLMVTRILFGIVIIIITALFACFRGDSFPNEPGLFYWLGGGNGASVLGWMAAGMGSFVKGSTSLEIVMIIVTVLVAILGAATQLRITLKDLRYALLNGLRYGVPVGIVTGICSILIIRQLEGWHNAIPRGIAYALFSGLNIILSGSLVILLRSQTSEYQEDQQQKKYIRSLRNRLTNTVLFGCCAAIGFASLYALQSGGFDQIVITNTLIISIFYGFVFGVGNGTEVIYIGVEIKPAECVVWSWQAVKQELAKNGERGMLIGLIIFIVVSINIGCFSSIFYGIQYGFRYGVIYGAIVGITAGVASLLTKMLTSGWSSDIIADMHQFNQPNEGIRRSLKNALYSACVFGPIGGIASGLIGGVAFGLGGISGWPILALGLSLVYTVTFALNFFIRFGGIAFLEHYTLRWYLWHAGYIPQDYISFLDYCAERILLRKVGGGYIFAHRLLLEYFSSLP